MNFFDFHKVVKQSYGVLLTSVLASPLGREGQQVPRSSLIRCLRDRTGKSIFAVVGFRPPKAKR